MKRPLILGNWKLYGNKKKIRDLISKIHKEMHNIKKCDVSIAPPIIYLDFVSRLLDKSYIHLTSQNVDINLSGAFTGETSVEMLVDFGIKYVIIGHSERRKYHCETDQHISKKFSVVKQAGLIPILCIGETKQEYQSKNSKSICLRQLDYIIDYLGIKALEGSVIAYEPIWAIGSGIHADVKHVQYIHECIRKHIDRHDSNISKNIIIQYGGSVDINNFRELFYCKDVDGFLIGKSSLNSTSFTRIVKEIDQMKK